MKRASVILKTQGTETITHDTFVSFVWHLLTLGNSDLATQLHDRAKNKQRYMPFVWSLQTWSSGATLLFSSHREDIAQAFQDGCKQAVGTAELIDGRLIEVERLVPIRDVAILSESVTVQTLSPITVSKPFDPKVGKAPKRSLLFRENADLWLTQVAENLKKKTQAYFEVTPEISVQRIKSDHSTVIPYKGGKVYGEMLTLKVTSSLPEGIETALYAGLGERNGSGFGMVSVI